MEEQDVAQSASETVLKERCGERGKLKIFFGYAPGGGRTYSMLQAANAVKRRGQDVVVGCIKSDVEPRAAALLEQFEQLPPLPVEYSHQQLSEFDLNAAIKRRPKLILVDELAHINASSCKNPRRYQDIEALLQAGINVYTTANVQQIESLHDIILSITGRTMREAIPDYVFDTADYIELVDIEPENLMERLRAEGGLKGKQEENAGDFTLEAFAALREIAMRRCADRVSLLSERAYGGTQEHILVCLSPAPSNAKTIHTAAKMASAFHGTFTALFVETSAFSSISEEDKDQLRQNSRLAQQLGAKLEKIYGEDVPLQVSEFARLSGVSKIVIGHGVEPRHRLFRKPTLSEQLIASAPDLDIHVVSDHAMISSQKRKQDEQKRTGFNIKDTLKTIVCLLLTTCVSLIFARFEFTEASIMTIYIFGVLVVSIITTQQIHILISSFLSVIIFNFFFTDPKLTLLAYDRGYPLAFVVMFVAASITGSLMTRLQNHAEQSAQSALRTKILLDTNQLLQQGKNRDEIITVMANQLTKLLSRDVVVYLAEGDMLGIPHIFCAEKGAEESALLMKKERAVAVWALKNGRYAGTNTDLFSDAAGLYLPIHVDSDVYGVVGIIANVRPLDAFEHNILLSILGECALALENEKNAREKEEAAILAKNEQLRANLLRAISHDLRTPLTSISGNASNLLSNGQNFDESTKIQLYTDIYDDAMWLISLVENLLSVTRIEDGRMNLRLATELIDEIITEALHHINRKSVEHQIVVKNEEEFLLVKVDAKLMVQVIINIVDNAIKYTQKGSEIVISYAKKGDQVVVSIADNGPGIPDEIKPRVFDMFYSGANRIADSRRSLGLGLSLCKSIVNAHGGEIAVTDNQPHGTIFTFTLPAGEVQLHEQ